MESGRQHSRFGKRRYAFKRKQYSKIKELIIEGKLEKGKQLASLGFTDKAIALFKQAQNIDPDVDLDPETKTIDKDPKVLARKLAAPAQVSEGGRLAKEGKITEAIKLFEEAQQFSPEIDLDPNTEEVDRDPEKVAKKLASKPN